MFELHEVCLIDAPVKRCFDLARSVDVHLLDNSHCGERTAAVAGQTTGLVNLGQHVTWRARHFGIRQSLTTRITAFNPPISFEDTMVSGAFRSMRHGHFFRRLAGDRTEMTDVLHVAAPLPVLGPVAEVIVLRRYMRMLLLERSVVLKRVAESSEWKNYLLSPVPAAFAHR